MSNRACPVCGHQLPAEWKQYNRMAFGEAIAPGAEYERREPTREPTLVGDVAVPGLQALVTGAVLGAAGGALAGLAGADRWLPVSVAVGGAVTGLAWLVLLSEQRRLLWRVETIIGADLNQDGAVGKPTGAPEGEPRDRLVLLHSNTERNRSPIRRQFEQFVRGCDAHGTAQNYWESTGGLDRDTYLRFRDSLMRLGWAEWRSTGAPNQGWELTADPDVIIRGMFRE